MESVAQILLFITIPAISVNSLPNRKQYLAGGNEKVITEKYFSNSVGNPYILACNSSSQCQDTILDECITEYREPDTWYCNCFCDGYGPCNINRDCCNNNCIKRICSHNGGEQGTVCSEQCSPCAKQYERHIGPDGSAVGYCDYSGGNPWIYAGCPNGDSDCKTLFHKHALSTIRTIQTHEFATSTAQVAYATRTKTASKTIA